MGSTAPQQPEPPSDPRATAEIMPLGGVGSGEGIGPTLTRRRRPEPCLPRLGHATPGWLTNAVAETTDTGPESSRKQ
jgi:hypothetical protein